MRTPRSCVVTRLRAAKAGVTLLGACSTALPPAPADRAGESLASMSSARTLPGRVELDRVGQQGLLWRFHAGAPVLGQVAVSPRGNVYVGTAEGYVHALDSDGGYRWSYTVRGSVVGSPAVGADDTVFVGTTEKRVYALRANGTLGWIFRSPASVVTDMLLDGDGLLYGGEETLYKLSFRGQITGWVSVPGGIAQGPVSSDGQGLLLATRGGDVLSVRKQHTRVVGRAAGALAQAPRPGMDGHVLLIDGNDLVVLGADGGELFRRPGVLAAASAKAGAVAVTSDGELVWVNAVGKSERHIALESGDCGGAGRLASAAPPCVAPDGRVYVSTSDGRLFVVAPSGVERCIQIGRVPLSEPVVDLERWRVVLSGRDGGVAAVRLSGNRGGA